MNLDTELGYINIDPDSVTPEEAIELIKDHDIAQDCKSCECPEAGIQHYVYDWMIEESYIIWCHNPCQLAMSDEEYWLAIGASREEDGEQHADQAG